MEKVQESVPAAVKQYQPEQKQETQATKREELAEKQERTKKEPIGGRGQEEQIPGQKTIMDYQEYLPAAEYREIRQNAPLDADDAGERSSGLWYEARETAGELYTIMSEVRGGCEISKDKIQEAYKLAIDIAAGMEKIMMILEAQDEEHHAE